MFKFSTTALLAALVSTGANAQEGCFNSTFAIVQAQLAETRPDSERKVYTICDDTAIPIGVPANAAFTEFVNGDFPLGVILPNVTIECSGCSLVGGQTQFATLPEFLAFGVQNTTTDGLIVRGLTFEGDIIDITGPDGSISAFGTSVAFYAPGKGMLVENITIRNMKTVRAVVVGGSSVVTDFRLSPRQVELTIKDSLFENIEMDSPEGVIVSYSQVATVERSKFKGITGTSVFSYYLGSVNSLKDSCFDDINVTEGIISGYADDLKDTLTTGLYAGESIVPGAECEDGNLVRRGIVNSTEFRLISCTDPFDSDVCVVDGTSAPTASPDGGAGTPPSATPTRLVQFAASAVVVAASVLLL